MAEFLGPDTLALAWGFVWRSILIIAACAAGALVLLYAAVIWEALTHPHKPSRHSFRRRKASQLQFLALMHDAQLHAQSQAERTGKAQAQQQREVGLSEDEIRTKAQQFRAWTFGPVE